VRVGGEKRFEMHLGDRHVDGRRERCQRRDQPQLTVVRAQPQGNGEADRLDARVEWRDVARELGDELVEARVGTPRRRIIAELSTDGGTARVTSSSSAERLRTAGRQPPEPRSTS
jgi:hypothetical protein